MGKNYIAVKCGRVSNVIFVCEGHNRCRWYRDVWPLIEGTPHQRFMGFDTLDSAVAFLGVTGEVRMIHRDEAQRLIFGA